MTKVREYAEAARIVKAQFPKAIFQLAGRLDSNPSSINSKELKFWINEGLIKYLGELSSVQKLLLLVKFMCFHLTVKDCQDLSLKLWLLEGQF